MGKGKTVENKKIISLAYEGKKIIIRSSLTTTSRSNATRQKKKQITFFETRSDGKSSSEWPFRE
jgi:hypothetical protein